METDRAYDSQRCEILASFMSMSKPSANRHRSRKGMEVVEAAITLPVLVIVAFMTIDICNAIHLKQAANTIAFETVRAASKKNASFAGAKEIGKQFAEARGLSNFRITVEPMNRRWRDRRDLMNVGHTMRAYVDVPVRGNVAGGPFFLFQNSTIRSQLVRMSAQ